MYTADINKADKLLKKTYYKIISRISPVLKLF